MDKFERWKKIVRPFAVLSMVGLAAAVMIKPALAEEDRAVVSGVVFEDKNGNGQQEGNEKGLEGVSVSDGMEITKTDEKGNYTLKVDTERRINDLVFITIPTGYGVPTDQYMTPQFYKQLGQLQVNENRQQNFGLLPKPESKNPNFNFVNYADVHVQAGTANNLERFSGQLAQTNELTGNPAFVAVSGDLTNGATDQEFQDYRAATAKSKLPVFPAVGNHDLTAGATYKDRIDRYRQLLGPEWYSYDYGNKHFVTLENNVAFSDPQQLEWLRQDLELNAKGKEVVVIVHKPLNTPQTPSPDNTKKFIELLGQYKTSMLLMGHTHVNDVSADTIKGAKHIITNSASYTIDQSPNGFRIINFKGGKPETPFKMFDVKQSLTIVNPAPNSKIAQDETVIQINAYNTSSNVKEAKYRIDGRSWKKLNRTSAFTWVADWDAEDLKKGQHQIDVKITDDAPKTWEKSSVFQVVDEDSVSEPKGGEDWTMFKGNAQHTGKALDVLAPELNFAWSHRTPGSILTSSPAIVDGTVYVGTRDENGSDNNTVVAVDLEDGEKRWKFKADSQVQSSPAVADRIVYASSIRGTLYALDTKSGEKLWEKSVGKDEVQRAWMYYSPTVSDGVVYQAYSTGKGGALMALDAKTGQELWTSKLAGNWIAENSPVVKDGRVYVGADGGYLIAFDAKTGAEQWRKRPAGGWMHSMPAIDNGRIYMGYGGGLVVALDAATGNELWRYKSEDSSYIAGGTTGSSPAIVDGKVYMGFPDGNIAALDAVTGQKKWSYRTQGGIISSPAISGNILYIGSNDGNLYALDRTTGEKKWNFEIGAWVGSSPAISGNTLVVGAFDGNLYAFTTDKKEEKKKD